MAQKPKNSVTQLGGCKENHAAAGKDGAGWGKDDAGKTNRGRPQRFYHNGNELEGEATCTESYHLINISSRRSLAPSSTPSPERTPDRLAEKSASAKKGARKEGCGWEAVTPASARTGIVSVPGADGETRPKPGPGSRHRDLRGWLRAARGPGAKTAASQGWMRGSETHPTLPIMCVCACVCECACACARV